MAQSKRRYSTGLDRAISKLGYCSRSVARRMVLEGHVALNGKPVTNPETAVRLGEDTISVSGNPIHKAGNVYLMLNKPRGLVTSASDDQGREAIYSLLPESQRWLAPVGRLDKASEGLLLLTNDGPWGDRIASPDSHLEKIYHVQIAHLAGPELLARLLAGLQTSNGDLLKVKQARIIRHGGKNSWLEIMLDEGKNRHIRRLLEVLGIEVLRLVRVAIGPLRLGDLPKGSSRELSPREKLDLDAGLRKVGKGRGHCDH